MKKGHFPNDVQGNSPEAVIYTPVFSLGKRPFFVLFHWGNAHLPTRIGAFPAI